MGRALVVDDEPMILTLARLALAPYYEEVVLVQTVEEALAALAGGTIDCLLCDWRLAGETTEGVLAAAAERSPGARRFAMSGYTEDPGLKAVAERVGLEGLIRKPWTPSRLRAALGF